MPTINWVFENQLQSPNCVKNDLRDVIKMREMRGEVRKKTHKKKMDIPLFLWRHMDTIWALSNQPIASEILTQPRRYKRAESNFKPTKPHSFFLYHPKHPISFYIFFLSQNDGCRENAGSRGHLQYQRGVSQLWTNVIKRENCITHLALSMTTRCCIFSESSYRIKQR